MRLFFAQATSVVEEACASPSLGTIQLALLLQEALCAPSAEYGGNLANGEAEEDSLQRRHEAWFKAFCNGCNDGDRACTGLLEVAKGAELLAKSLTETLPVARLPALGAYKLVLQGKREGRIIDVNINVVITFLQSLGATNAGHHTDLIEGQQGHHLQVNTQRVWFRGLRRDDRKQACKRGLHMRRKALSWWQNLSQEAYLLHGCQQWHRTK